MDPLIPNSAEMAQNETRRKLDEQAETIRLLKSQLATLESNLYGSIKAPDPSELDPSIPSRPVSTSPCPVCQTVHDPSAPQVTCRCGFCGQVKLIVTSAADPVLGVVPVCGHCAQSAGIFGFGQPPSEPDPSSTQPSVLPWETQ